MGAVQRADLLRSDLVLSQIGLPSLPVYNGWSVVQEGGKYKGSRILEDCTVVFDGLISSAVPKTASNEMATNRITDSRSRLIPC